MKEFSLNFVIFYRNFVQNWFPGSAHILPLEFLTVSVVPLRLPAGHAEVDDDDDRDDRQRGKDLHLAEAGIFWLGL